MQESLKEEFLNPSSEYTPIPFWFWNDQLTNEELIKQIRDFYEKGVMGFVLHPRIGIPADIEYLSDRFMDFVITAVEEAAKLGMKVILYDEAMYPSGAAKGFVVQDNPEFASRGLKMVEYRCEEHLTVPIQLDKEEKLVSVAAVEKESDHSINPTATVVLEIENGQVRFQPTNKGDWSIVLFVETFSNGNIRGIHFGEDDGEENAPPSADLLNPAAVQKFIHLTHERYYEKLSRYFGNTIQAMFTDEPDILGRGGKKDLKPWTGDFLAWFKENGGKVEDLPILWFDAGPKSNIVRKQYQKAINKRLSISYYQPLSEWCERHQIALTGHPAASDDIGLLEHFQIPGQDIVWRWVGPEEQKSLEGAHSTAGKCSSDAARHRGRRRNLNEVLGVCGKESEWDLSPGDMKWYLDWLFVRGVNMISPHAFYYSIEGRRRSHERPPDVGPNSAWWLYFNQFSDYMKRLSWLMTDSINQTEVAVLCGENHLPWRMVKPLYENQIEFNYLEESLFQEKCLFQNGGIQIEEQFYKVLLIEDVTKLDSATKVRAEEFISCGGKVLILTENLQSSDIEGAKRIVSIANICEVLEHHIQREVNLEYSCKDIRISHVKKSGLSFYLLVNEGEKDYNGSVAFREKGIVEKWDAWDGTIENAEGLTDQTIALELNRRESIIYVITPNDRPSANPAKYAHTFKKVKTLSEDWKVKGDLIGVKETPLISWTKWPQMQYFSGTFTYEQSFEVEQSIEKAIIDLGEVFEIAKLSVNGQEIGVKMWAPYRFELTNVIKQGINQIIIEVTNSKANQMDQIELPSGLLGPVELRY
jgi:hypothetical protein